MIKETIYLNTNITSPFFPSRVKSVTANFFGVGDNAKEDQKRWQSRRSRHLSRRHGGVKPHLEDEVERDFMSMGAVTHSSIPHIIDPLGKNTFSLSKGNQWC